MCDDCLYYEWEEVIIIIMSINMDASLVHGEMTTFGANIIHYVMMMMISGEAVNAGRPSPCG